MEQVKPMMLKTIIVLSAAPILFAMFAADAKGDSLPGIDVKGNCTRRSESVGDLAIGMKQTVDSCVTSELQARDALAAAWKDIPPSYKEECIRPDTFSASYMEWIACLETRIDVKNIVSKAKN